MPVASVQFAQFGHQSYHNDRQLSHRKTVCLYFRLQRLNFGAVLNRIRKSLIFYRAPTIPKISQRLRAVRRMPTERYVLPDAQQQTTFTRGADFCAGRCGEGAGGGSVAETCADVRQTSQRPSLQFSPVPILSHILLGSQHNNPSFAQPPRPTNHESRSLPSFPLPPNQHLPLPGPMAGRRHRVIAQFALHLGHTLAVLSQFYGFIMFDRVYAEVYGGERGCAVWVELAV